MIQIKVLFYSSNKRVDMKLQRSRNMLGHFKLKCSDSVSCNFRVAALEIPSIMKFSLTKGRCDNQSYLSIRQ